MKKYFISNHSKRITKLFVSFTSIALITTSTVTSVYSHPGRLDSSGGHNKKADGTYHYHYGSDKNTEYSKPQSSNYEEQILATPEPTPSPEITHVPVSTSNLTQESTPSPTITHVPVSTLTSDSTSNSASISSEIIVLVDGQKIIFDQPPIILNGRVLVPIRFVVEKMNCKVDWDDSTNTVYINDSNSILEKNAILSENINVNVNNEKIDFLDQKPVVVNGRVLIPVRFVTEKLGYDVAWDKDINTVLITSKNLSLDKN